jgi:hypothetical protein
MGPKRVRSVPTPLRGADEIEIEEIPNRSNSAMTTAKYDVFRRKIREVLRISDEVGSGSVTLPVNVLSDDNLSKCFTSIGQSYGYTESSLKTLQAAVRSDLVFHGLPLLYSDSSSNVSANTTSYKYTHRAIAFWRSEMKNRHQDKVKAIVIPMDTGNAFLSLVTDDPFLKQALAYYCCSAVAAMRNIDCYRTYSDSVTILPADNGSDCSRRISIKLSMTKNAIGGDMDGIIIVIILKQIYDFFCSCECGGFNLLYSLCVSFA